MTTSTDAEESTLAANTRAQGAELDIYLGDNLPLLRSLPAGTYDLIYIDPPFNTGKTRTRIRATTRVATGQGFKGSGIGRFALERSGSPIPSTTS